MWKTKPYIFSINEAKLWFLSYKCIFVVILNPVSFSWWSLFFLVDTWFTDKSFIKQCPEFKNMQHLCLRGMIKEISD